METFFEGRRENPLSNIDRGDPNRQYPMGTVARVEPEEFDDFLYQTLAEQKYLPNVVSSAGLRAEVYG